MFLMRNTDQARSPKTLPQQVMRTLAAKASSVLRQYKQCWLSNGDAYGLLQLTSH